MYQPKQIDTSSIVLDEELLSLVEVFAETVHDVWALGRMKEGYIYGETRDEIKKTHPCLVPYHELAESEKDFDRNTAMETIKLLLSLGYEIIKK